jgi:hypothetical protein
MVKILLCGSVNGEWKLLCDKVNALHKSAHGPFDLLFCTGAFFRDENDVADLTSYQLPLPVYIYDKIGSNSPSLPPNVHFLPSVGTVMINDLVVASVVANGDLTCPEDYDQLIKSGSTLKYDLLLSSEWPKDLQNFLPER